MVRRNGWLGIWRAFWSFFRIFFRFYVRFKKNNSGASFELALLGLSAVVIKADGKVKQELNYVKTFRQNFGEAKSKKYFKVFNDLKNKQAPSLRSLCTQVNQNVNHNGRLQIIHFYLL